MEEKDWKEYIEYTVYIGLYDKDSKTQEISTEDAMRVIDKICMAYVSGCTVTQRKWCLYT